MHRADVLYGDYRLRRVYYSGFSPIPEPSALLPIKPPPLVREHRLYQADWLLRFYGFKVNEITTATAPNPRQKTPIWILSAIWVNPNRPHPTTQRQSHEGSEEAALARETLRHLRTPLHLAQEVGTGLGRREVLQRPLPDEEAQGPPRLRPLRAQTSGTGRDSVEWTG